MEGTYNSSTSCLKMGENGLVSATRIWQNPYRVLRVIAREDATGTLGVFVVKYDDLLDYSLLIALSLVIRSQLVLVWSHEYIIRGSVIVRFTETGEGFRRPLVPPTAT